MCDRDSAVPESLRQVWAWKESIEREVAHLSTREALRAISEKAHEAAKKHNFPRGEPRRPLAKTRSH